MISQDLVETYQRDGVVCLRDAIPEKWLALGREGIDQNLKNPGRFFRDHTPTGASSRYVFEYWTWPQTPQFEDVIRNSPLGEIAGTLMQANHPATVLPGTTTSPILISRERFASFGFRLSGLRLRMASLLYIDAHSENYEFLSWEVDVGDCLVFDFRTLHCVTNRDQSAQQSQRRMTFRFGADNTVFSPRGKWTEETSAYLMGLGQKPDGPIDCDLMPKVWTL